MKKEYKNISWFYHYRKEYGLLLYTILFLAANTLSVILQENNLASQPGSVTLLSLLFFILFVSLLLILYILRAPQSFVHYTILHTALFISIFLLGLCNPFIHKVKNTSDLISEERLFRGRVERVEITTNNNTRYLISIGGEKFYIYSETKGINPGDYVELKTTLRAIRKFEEGFDYPLFLKRKGILSSGYVPAGEIIKTGDRSGMIRYRMYAIQDAFISYLHTIFNNSPALPLVIALCTGERSLIDEQTFQSFRTTGVVHVLALSGLHIGILYKVIGILLSFFGNTRFSRWFRSILTLLILWSFAIFTSLGVSILRAVIMATCHELSRLLSRQTNGFNALSLSMFIIISIDPHSPFDIGFQLSFSAMAGIYLISPVIQNAITIKNKIISYLWDLISITVSCQITTFPFIISVFGTFPTLFLISNIVVIPLITIIVVSLLLILIFSFIPIVSGLLTHLLINTIDLLLHVINYLGGI